ncbi:hypothetical protein [Desulfuromonas sp. TF]|uniref:hypothetical protein n=1 Tax=Desulfuromonas sp. TF TaxID=1232410 RepID=UPI000421373A|nr:hypothetical protein [Desulfuromonas sp. TF]
MEKSKKPDVLGTAQACRFPVEEMETIVGRLLERMDEVIQAVTNQRPSSFPDDVAGSILDGMREARDRLIRYRQ